MNNSMKKSTCNPPQLQAGVLLLAVEINLIDISLNIIATMANIHKPPLKKATVGKSALKTTQKTNCVPARQFFGG